MNTFAHCLPAHAFLAFPGGGRMITTAPSLLRAACCSDRIVDWTRALRSKQDSVITALWPRWRHFAFSAHISRYTCTTHLHLERTRLDLDGFRRTQRTLDGTAFCSGSAARQRETLRPHAQRAGGDMASCGRWCGSRSDGWMDGASRQD